MRLVQVPLGNRSYEIRIGRGLLSTIGEACAALGLSSRCAVVSDTKVAPLYGRLVQTSLKKAGFQPLAVTIPAGERAKTLKHVHACYDLLAAHRLERKSFVVALGGGVVGDLAGFVAATYLRGIPFVQAPTTLLGQVDSSVGGKVGVNLRAGKNLVGAFHQPKLVLCDVDALRTLPLREFKSGLAEVIKYGIICDSELFARLEREMESLGCRAPQSLTEIIARCCEIKAEVVAQDETEAGLRAILNFGHTIGHALEAVSGYGRFLHGEAISIGQVKAANLSALILGLGAEDARRIEELLEKAGLPTKFQAPLPLRKKLLQAMKVDKKVSGGEVKFVLARKIGQVQFGCAVPEPLIHEVLS